MFRGQLPVLLVEVEEESGLGKVYIEGRLEQLNHTELVKLTPQPVQEFGNPDGLHHTFSIARRGEGYLRVAASMLRAKPTLLRRLAEELGVPLEAAIDLEDELRMVKPMRPRAMPARLEQQRPVEQQYRELPTTRSARRVARRLEREAALDRAIDEQLEFARQRRAAEALVG